jgi:hypothetical protein
MPVSLFRDNNVLNRENVQNSKVLNGSIFI